MPDSVLIRNTPLTYGERLNQDLGIYIQDSWRLNRLTANVGLRWETLNAKVLAGKSPAGRFVPERTFDEIADVPDWNDFAPRMALVYDLFGNGRTAIKYSLNRYNLSRTTGIAANYNPLLSQTATLPWRDVNGNDIADGAAALHRLPERRVRDRLRHAVAELRHRRAQRVRRVSAHLEPRAGRRDSARAVPGVSVSGAWWYGQRSTT